jgi:hypothetical protein
MIMPQSSSHFSSNPSLHISPMSVSTSLSAMPSFDKNGLDSAQASLNRLQQLIGLLDSSLRLPNTARAFMIYLVGLAIIFTGAFMHVFVAAQIMQAEFTLHQLQEEYRALEQQNGDIIFQIARDTNMQKLHERAVLEGYVNVEQREYAFAPADVLAETAPLADSSAKNIAPAAAAPSIASSTTRAASTNQSGSQFARWEEFWNTTWQAAIGGTTTTQSSQAATLSNTQSGKTQLSKAAPNFWAAWWEQATQQGAKLLDQLHDQ